MRKDGKFTTIIEKDAEDKTVNYFFGTPVRLAPIFAEKAIALII